ALYVFLVSQQSGVQFRQLSSVRGDDLGKKIRKYRDTAILKGLSTTLYREKPWTHSSWDALRTQTDELYQALLQPIAAEIERADHLIFSPSGLLYYLPLHALGPKDPRTGDVRFLAERKSVSYITSATLLGLALKRSTPGAPTLFALGNPVFQQP